MFTSILIGFNADGKKENKKKKTFSGRTLLHAAAAVTAHARFLYFYNIFISANNIIYLLTVMKSHNWLL